MSLKKYGWHAIALGIIILDQLAKLLVLKNISSAATLHIIPGIIDFVFVKNTGAAFSILSNNTVLLGIVSLLFCIGVALYWYKAKPENILMKVSLTLVFAGAFGNAIDRLARGYVIDFIKTAFMNFPVFNVADIAITSGAVLLAVYLILFDKDGEEHGETDSADAKSEQSAD